MSDRLTSAHAEGIAGIAEWGRVDRSTMLDRFRTYYRLQLAEAERALSLPDEEIITETFLGPYAQRNREPVQ